MLLYRTSCLRGFAGLEDADTEETWMATLTTEKLGATVGALVIGVDCERLLTDERLRSDRAR